MSMPTVPFRELGRGHTTPSFASAEDGPQFTSDGGATYLTVYGWTRGPLIEWYIVDRFIDWTAAQGSPTDVSPVGTATPVQLGGNRVWHGTVSANGGIYDVVTSWRINEPSIDGTQTFLQIFSVRRGGQVPRNQDNPTSGTIDVSAHFNAWAQIPEQTPPGGGTGIRFGPSAQLYEVSFTVEGFGGANPSTGSGWVRELCIRYGPYRVCTNPTACSHC